MTRRRPRPLRRDINTLRDARLFLVATEDTYAPDQYLAQFRLTRVQIKVLPTLDSRSSAQDVLKRLKKYRDEYELEEDDLLWVLWDTDRFATGTHLKSYTTAIQEAQQSNIFVCISNPCFDFWLLLHVAELTDLSTPIHCKAVGDYLRKTLGRFNKHAIDTTVFNLENLPEAYRKAKELDTLKRIPPTPGSQVYRLIDELLKSEPTSHLPLELLELAKQIKAQ